MKKATVRELVCRMMCVLTRALALRGVPFLRIQHSLRWAVMTAKVFADFRARNTFRLVLVKFVGPFAGRILLSDRDAG
jgi:hypothetical protein